MGEATGKVGGHMALPWSAVTISAVFRCDTPVNTNRHTRYHLPKHLKSNRAGRFILVLSCRKRTRFYFFFLSCCKKKRSNSKQQMQQDFFFCILILGIAWMYGNMFPLSSKNRPRHIKRTFTRVSVNNLINWKSIYLNAEFCPSLHCLSLTDGVVGAYVQFDLNQTLSQFLHWHEISASQIHTLAVRNSSGEGATLWKNDEGQNLERHSRKSHRNFSLLFHFACVLLHYFFFPPFFSPLRVVFVPSRWN